MKVLQYPLARLVFFYIGGLLLADCYTPTFETSIYTWAGCFAVCLILVYGVHRKNWPNFLFGISAGILTFATALCVAAVCLNAPRQDHLLHQEQGFGSPHSLTVTITEQLRPTANRDRYFVALAQLDGQKSSGALLLQINKSKTGTDFLPGTVLLLYGSIQDLPKPYNPGQFDYGLYLQRKGISGQIFVAPTAVKVLAESNGPKTWAARFRNRIIANLKSSGMRAQELAVVSALILGQQQDISKDVIRDYQYAGAVHILSVSGLHVGYIMLFVNLLFARLPKNNKGNLVRLVGVLVCLWSFSLVAGLSPSIVRAATMFSFVAVGRYLKRGHYVFHTLLASLFFILLVSPSFLFDVGFQLSYISLFFILWLQPFFAGFWQPKSKPLLYVWEVLTVSAAAQLGAFPLSLYYFHQFPGLFFATNLIILPALGLIMALGAVVMAVALVGLVPSLLIWPLQKMVWLMNTAINWIASAEQFVLREIPMNLLLMVALYGCMGGLLVAWMRPRFRTVTLAVVGLIGLQLAWLYTDWRVSGSRELVVLRVRNNSLLAQREGRLITVYGNDSVRRAVAKNTVLHNYATDRFSTLKSTAPLRNLLFFGHQKILILGQDGQYLSTAKPDILLVTHSPKINFERAVTLLKPKLVIADASNYRSYVRRWACDCQKQKIPFHAVAEKGSFILK